MTHAAYKVSMTLESASDERFCARVVTLHNPNADVPEAFEVRDILEHENLDTLRDAFKSNGLDADVTHYRVYSDAGVRDYAGGWSDALRVAKDREFAKATEVGADVRKNMSLRHLVEARFVAVEADLERRRLDAVREARLANEKAEREARAAARVDFDAWVAAARQCDDESRLVWAMRRAKSTVEGWAKTRDEFTAKLAKNPVYALSWSGDVVEAAAAFEVSTWMVEAFEAGATREQMTEEALREVMRAAKYASSRSTSAMSNLTEDATRAAWAKAYEMLTGR